MAILTADCPQCRARMVGLHVMKITRGRNDGRVSAFTFCPACLECSIFVLEAGPGSTANELWFGSSEAMGGHDIITRTKWRIVKRFPEEKEDGAPPDTPAEVDRIFTQAKSAHIRNEYDGAAMLYRKALETAVKSLDKDGKGSLDARIKALSKNDLIPDAVANWAHEIRGIGNEAAHDAEEPSKEDVDAAAEFVEAFLTYAFTMPAKIRNRMTKSEEPLQAF